MNIRAFKPEDGMALRECLTEMAWNGVLTLEKFQAITGPAFTAVHNGRIIGCGGVMIQGREGIAWAMFAGDLPLKTALDGAIVVKDKLNEIIREYHLDCVYCDARADFPKAQRYLRFLGFDYVGPIESNQRDGAETLMYVKGAA